uniref:Alternative protein PIKFYVE n=1 Tax=Homo sapiens TaxID=9606 RepID=L8E9N1_HUMAN|nr:alternative protein PIKFYVE [Homo sapiens]
MDVGWIVLVITTSFSEMSMRCIDHCRVQNFLRRLLPTVTQ